MPTPDRKYDRLSLSRRNEQQRQEQQQEQQTSPFRRARFESRPIDVFDASRIPSPSNKYSAQHRKNFSQTRTLRGAFEATSRFPTMSEREGVSSSIPYATGTPSPRRKRQSFNPISPESNPPDELLETYRQIDDAGSLVDLDPEEDYFQTDQFRESRNRRFSGSASSFLNDISEESPRRKLGDHVQDEQRLKRATTSRSPVLSKGGTKPALTAENLQRRDEEDQLVSDEYDGFKPSLNLPSAWGSRATRHRDWLRNVTAPESERKPEVPTDISSSKAKLDFSSRPTPTRASEPAANRIPLSDAQNKLGSDHREVKSIQGNPDPILNPPVMVYNNSTFRKRSPTKRDSQDLLRKLARTESPHQHQSQEELRTPEPPKIIESRIYDKTPVVTGAWIDTPMTERVQQVPKSVAELSEDLTKDIFPSPAAKNKPLPRFDEKPKIGSLSKRENDAEKEKAREGARKQREWEQEKVKEENEERKKEGEKAKKQEKKTKPPLVKPDLPKSALETVMQDYRADKDSLAVGDDTIESLQLILDEQPTESKIEVEDDAPSEDSILEELELNSAARETVDLDRLNEKLQSLAENINKVKKGLDNLENQVSQDAFTLSSLPTNPTGQSLPKHVKASESCEACGAQNDGRFYAAVRSLYLWRQDPVSRRIRPTRLGWCAILLLTWLHSESTMCDYYCHPFVADVCEGNCLLPDAPRFPFVIPTMLWRWSHLSTTLTPVFAVMIALFRLTAQLLGFWDGYVEDTPRPVHLSGEIRIHGTRVSHLPATATSSQGFFARPSLGKEPKYTPEAVPELNIGHDAPSGNWDEASIDDDEYI